MKVLLFSDSRGVHKPAGSTHSSFSQRLAKTDGLSVTSFLCPYQWTTIPDFIHLAREYDLSEYDYVILHAGIVDHSPRPLQQALDQIYMPVEITPEAEVKTLLATRVFSRKKIVNRKKFILDAIFGEDAMLRHLAAPFPVSYEGQPTINLYSIDMMRRHLLPRLREIENLIFISANAIVAGWRGDYPRERPDNIGMIEEYSKLLCQELPSVVNLHQWSSEDVKRFTCDNMHLSAKGSDWIYLRLLESLGLRRRNYLEARRSVGAPADQTPWPLNAAVDPATLDSIIMKEPATLDARAIEKIRERLGRVGQPIATLIIGVRLKPDDISRLDSLKFLMACLETGWGDLFDILILEQDQEPRGLPDLLSGRYRYAFIYNPEAYNRGWLYNVAVKHYTDCPVVAFCDTDILPGSNFLDCIIDCYSDYDAVSPNRSLYYSTPEEKAQVLASGTYAEIPVTEAGLKNPTSFAGGMMVFNRAKFLEIGGFEQYVGYGCEDRALDVTMLALLAPERIRMDSYAYFHLHHPTDKSARIYFRDIYAHMVEHYGCEYTAGLSPLCYIHAHCCHEAPDKVRAMAMTRMAFIGDPDLYRRHSYVTINGLPPQQGGKLVPVGRLEPSFPPALTNLSEYIEKEQFLGKYAASWAPSLGKGPVTDDSEELAFFYNRYKGRRCFIIGNGPSLNRHNLDLLRDEYSFGVNSFYYKTRETGFRPTFFVVEDSSVMKENRDEIVNYEAPFKFFPTIYRSLHPKQPGTYFFRINRGFYEKSSPNYAIPRFSTDATKVLYCGQSVTYINLQLAFFMGFTEVFLIGMDFDYQIPESHKRTGDVLLSDTDDANHFHKDYFGKGKTWKDPKLDRVLMNYRMAKLIYECAGRRIYNATIGGKLEAFDRINYDGLFRGLDPSFNAPKPDLTRPGASSQGAPGSDPQQR